MYGCPILSRPCIHSIAIIYQNTMLFRPFSILARRSAVSSRLAFKAARFTPRIATAQNTTVRFASNSTGSEEQKVQEIITKLSSNPEIREILNEFQNLLQSKGFNPEKPPSLMEMMRLFADKEVRALAGKLKGKFDEEGIAITPEQLNLFMGLFKK